MNVTHKKVYTIYKVLYKMKQMKYNLKKLTLKLSTKATAGGQLHKRQQATCAGNSNSWYGERMLCAFLYKW